MAHSFDPSTQEEGGSRIDIVYIGSFRPGETIENPVSKRYLVRFMVRSNNQGPRRWLSE